VDAGRIASGTTLVLSVSGGAPQLTYRGDLASTFASGAVTIASTTGGSIDLGGGAITGTAGVALTGSRPPTWSWTMTMGGALG